MKKVCFLMLLWFSFFKGRDGVQFNERMVRMKTPFDGSNVRVKGFGQRVQNYEQQAKA